MALGEGDREKEDAQGRERGGVGGDEERERGDVGWRDVEGERKVERRKGEQDIWRVRGRDGDRAMG